MSFNTGIPKFGLPRKLYLEALARQYYNIPENVDVGNVFGYGPQGDDEKRALNRVKDEVEFWNGQSGSASTGPNTGLTITLKKWLVAPINGLPRYQASTTICLNNKKHNVPSIIVKTPLEAFESLAQSVVFCTAVLDPKAIREDGKPATKLTKELATSSYPNDTAEQVKKDMGELFDTQAQRFEVWMVVVD
ncbi:hypothetical protein EJ04DRAFT_556648 [Polyplosphaeria fusca]|uniref:Uncharacterized protein n=1 Tax=Polyplosphaeria fusca TaxID=682080 RepID=A0A9P4UU70_9PLEO|nr:hypothetical protein EJ04DRAFT_556648 [Polyplosphaeria fusca]